MFLQYPTNQLIWIHFSFTATDSFLFNFTDGIDPDKGNPAQDFSDGDGFYTTPDIHEAIDLAKSKNIRKKPGFKTAVIGYCIEKPDEFFKPESGVIFEADENWGRDRPKWLEVIRYFRFGKDLSKVKLQHYTKKEMDGWEYIIGPINGKGKNNKAVEEKYGRATKRISQQLCIKEGLEDEFQNYLGNVFVIFVIVS